MEGSSPVTGTSISVTRRRLQMLACLLLIFVALSSVGIGGYFAYQKVISIFNILSQKSALSFF